MKCFLRNSIFWEKALCVFIIFSFFLQETLKEDRLITSSSSAASTVSSIDINLNPCQIDFDPGLVDRTYMLFNYHELDPGCLATPPSCDMAQTRSKPGLSDLKVKVTSSWVGLKFHVPKADMRKPTEMTVAEFVRGFWTRSIHPELFELCLTDLDLVISQEAAQSGLTGAIVPPLKRVSVIQPDRGEFQRRPL